MELERRLKRLESKVRPTYTAPKHRFDLDQCLVKMGLVPAAVRELARSKGSSLAEATAEMIGIQLTEFKRQLKKALGLAG